ncbi:carbohydrate ABC transporter permease [Psychromicrobium xiongbiense]|uniref:carbohydrate ABC transporter permease n=1 Tax=Psychromicrobium xiongbiense TaxID=3051184 RepID=UPI0025551B4D|nr:sugar ABC transporter permease [Psychromicrobium sp. YIM S02556]
MRSHRRYTPWVLVAPALIWLAVFSFWPALNTIRMSFTNAKPLGGTERWVGLQNYTNLFTDPQLANALLNSVVYMVVCLPLLTLLPLGIALLVEKKLPGITFFRTTFYLPVVASAVVVALLWSWMLDDRGVINSIVEALGWLKGPLPFLTDRWLVVFSSISLTVWKGLGYYMVIYIAALGNVSKDLHEAAAIDGAGSWRRFWSVTVPGVRGSMTLVAIMICVSALRIFTEPYLLTGTTGGPGGQASSFVMIIQQYARGIQGNLGYASALSVALFFICLIPMLILARQNRKSEA